MSGLDFVSPRIDNVDIAHIVDCALFIDIHVQDALALAFSVGLGYLNSVVRR